MSFAFEVDKKFFARNKKGSQTTAFFMFINFPNEI